MAVIADLSVGKDGAITISNPAALGFSNMHKLVTEPGQKVVSASTALFATGVAFLAGNAVAHKAVFDRWGLVMTKNAAARKLSRSRV